MAEQFLHHVSIVVSNLQRSIDFYADVIGLTKLNRPPFKSLGAWFGVGHQQIHLNEKTEFKFSTQALFNPTGFHFALRVANINSTQKRFEALGYREDSDVENINRLVLDYHGVAGFPQLFLFDPDFNMIEINSEKL